MDPEDSPLVDLSPYWDVDDSEYDYCDCPGPPPPPQFVLPPPPPPPSLQLCQGGDDLQYCHLEPVGAEYTQTAFPSLPIIAVCSSVVLVAILVASFLLWKHKKKVQNFLPCKNEHQGHCDIASSNGVTYDDVLINHHPTRLPQHHGPDNQTLTPIELLDVKYGNYGPHHLAPLRHGNFPFPAKDNGTVRSGKGKEHFNPIYEEVSGGSEDKGDTRSYDSDIEDSEVEARTIGSEDEFAEDELSLAEYNREGSRPCSGTSSVQGSTGGDLCRDAGSGFSDGAGSEEGGSERRAMKGLLRPKDNGGKKRTHSLERNKDGHPSDGFHAKQNYYMGKTMLGPHLTYPDVAGGSGTTFPQRDTTTPVDSEVLDGRLPAGARPVSPAEPTPYAQSGGRSVTPHNEPHHNIAPVNVYHGGGALMSHLPSDSPPPPPYTPARPGTREQIPAVFNPPSSLKAPRLPGVVLSELNQKLANNGGPRPGLSPRAGAPPIFTVGPEEPYPPPHGTCRGRDETPDFTTFHHPAKPPASPQENIYSTIDEEGVAEGPSNVASRKPADAKQAFGRPTVVDRPPVPKEPNKVKGQSQNIPSQRPAEDENGPYGDIRPSFNTRTACT